MKQVQTDIVFKVDFRCSCHSNPGSSGTGACLFPPSQERIDLSQHVARRASILLSELVTIKMH